MNGMRRIKCGENAYVVAEYSTSSPNLDITFRFPQVPKLALIQTFRTSACQVLFFYHWADIHRYLV
jgi:hypothetical protein